MRIGLILPSLPAYSETFFSSKIQGLIESGFDVVLFTMSEPTKYQLCRHVSLNKGKGLMRPIRIGFGFIRLVFTRPVRVMRFIIAEQRSGRGLASGLKNLSLNAPLLSQKLHWVHFGFATMALGRENLGRAMGAKLATSFRGYDVSIYPLKHKGAYNLLWKRLDKVHTISDDLLDHAFALGLPAHIKVSKVTPAIDLNRFNKNVSEYQKSDMLRICTVARLHWKKGLEDTLQALCLLKLKGIDFSYTIVGDGEDYERLLFTAHDLGLADRVKFTGKVSHDQVNEILHSADMYIQYSISEGFCNAVLEAQAAGLLCVVSNAEGLSENVSHGYSGWVVNRFDVPGLATAIEDILKMPVDDLNRIRRQARQRVREKFSLEIQKEKFTKFYQEI